VGESRRGFRRLADIFLSQLRTDGQKNELIRNTCELTFSMLAHKGAEAFLTDTLAKVVNDTLSDYYQFCDLVLEHQIVELLFRQVAVPYHVNVERTAGGGIRLRIRRCSWT